MSKVIPFKRPARQIEYLLLYSDTVFPGRCPGPFWIEAWDGHRGSKAIVVWRSGTYRALCRAALEIATDVDRLIDYVAHPDLFDNVEAAMLAGERATAFALKHDRVLQ